MITMSQIAKQAGVSRATVSYVLNERREGVRVSEETRRHILSLANELGYRPNELARAVVTGKNRVLGFVSGGSDYEPVARSLSGAIQEAGLHNHFLKVFHLPGRTGIKDVVENSIRMRLMGLVVYSLHEFVDKTSLRDEMRQELQHNGIPMAVVGSNMYIHSDDRQGFSLAIDHLYQQGHRRIAFMAGMENAAISVARTKSWEQALAASPLGREAGSTGRQPLQVAHGDWELEPTLEALRGLMANPATAPTALVCVTDLAAMVVLRAARRLGLRVPEDLSLIGFGGLSTMGWTDPPLTTIAQPFEAMGAAAVRHLLRLTGDLPPSDAAGSDSVAETVTVDAMTQPRELLPLQLIVRESTLPPSR